jgi:uncharacterized protein
MDFKRAALDDLKTWKQSPARKPLILRGARQIGKTYLLKKFARSDFQAFHYVNFEKSSELLSLFDSNLNPKRILAGLELFLGRRIEVSTDLLILDEIQACPRALTSLKYFNEDCPELAVCAAGSLLGVTMARDSFPVGKVEFLDMYPLSFLEFLAANEHRLPLISDHLHAAVNSNRLDALAHAKLWELLLHYFIVGGLPEIVVSFLSEETLQQGFIVARKKQSELMISYESDIAKHSGKINSMHIMRLWHAVAAQLGRTVDGQSEKFKFKDVVPGVKGYDRLAGAIDWLEAAGLILKVPIIHRAELPLAAFIKDNTFKLFLFDVGMLGAMLGLPPTALINQDYGLFKGYFAENYVAQQLKQIGASPLVSWQENTSKIEFLSLHHEHIVPIEVKAGTTAKSKSLRVYNEKYKPLKRVILSNNALEVDNAAGLYRLPLFCAGMLRSYAPGFDYEN